MDEIPDSQPFRRRIIGDCPLFSYFVSYWRFSPDFVYSGDCPRLLSDAYTPLT